MEFFAEQPTNCKELEHMVSKAFMEIGYNVRMGENIQTVRGDVEIDVIAVNQQAPG